MNDFNKFAKEKKYLVAVSGGPDSMALLNMLYEAKFINLIVALVNYKKRVESDAEETLVYEYCKQRKIKFYSTNYNEEGLDGSFQVKAREFRYEFFKKLYKKLNCDGLFVAHHKDDLIETYLLKKQRNVINESYLILDKNLIKNMNVYRPLLNYYKNELEEYCKANNLQYGIDKSNFLPVYTRNKIRLELVKEDKEKIYQKALNDEKELRETIDEVTNFLKTNKKIYIFDISSKNDLFLQLFLYYKIDKKYQRLVNKNLLNQLKSFIKSNKANLHYQIEGNYYLIKAYEYVLFTYIKNDDFCYEVTSFDKFKTPYFEIVDKGKKMQGVYLENDDFPIMIRNYHENDKIKLKEGYKKISRLFIDKKIPIYLRKTYPIIENRHHEIVFVYDLYRNYKKMNSQNNYFMVK